MNDYKFVGPLPDKVICSICTELLREPQLTGCCGQHYCLECLRSWTKKQGFKSCPHCRTRGFCHILDKSVQREIKRLKIACSHHHQGCTWTGELGDLPTHLSAMDGCQYEFTRCPNKCSTFRGSRAELEKHLKSECLLRSYKCPKCGLHDTFLNVTSPKHANCRSYSLKCPNGCGKVNIQRWDLENHRKKCPMEPIRCPFGCSDIPRCNLQDHTKNECPLRRCRCEYCGLRSTYQYITTRHYSQCPQLHIPCPNGCGETFRLQAMLDIHRIHECPLQKLRCPLCTRDFTRTQLTKVHLREHGFDYFFLMLIVAMTKIARTSTWYRLITWYVQYTLKVYPIQNRYKLGISCLLGALFWYYNFGWFVCSCAFLLGLVIFYGYRLVYLYYMITSDEYTHV